MTRKYSIAWTNDFEGGESNDCETFFELLSKLQLLERSPGAVTLYPQPTPDLGPQLLQVFSDGRRYLLLLGEVTSEDYEVRIYDNGEERTDLVEFCGAHFPAQGIFQNFEVVIRAFEQFHSTGNVSRDLLS